MPLPGYSPDLMPVEALWPWLREDVTDHHCQASAEDLTRRVADFEGRLNRDPFVIADRLGVKDILDPEEEKLRFSKYTWYRIRGEITTSILLFVSSHGLTSLLPWEPTASVADLETAAVNSPRILSPVKADPDSRSQTHHR